MNRINLYTRISREVSEVLNEQMIEHEILPDNMEKELVVKFMHPFFGEARGYAYEALDSAVSYVQTLLGLKHRPEFLIIAPNMATVKKSFTDSDFARC